MVTAPPTAQSEYQRGKGKAKDVPPPPRTPPGCAQCVRSKGIPILPVRYAIAYNRQGKGPDGKALPPMPALSGKFAPPAGLESQGKQVNYTLRLLRGGYLYVWLTGAKQWLAWRVLKNTVLAKIEFNNDVDLNTYKDKDDGTFACATGGPHHLQRSRFITVPESETSIQLGWSPTRLTKKQLEEIRQKKPSVLQTITLPAGPHVGPADQLHQLVAEFATLPDAFYEHYRDFPAPLQTIDSRSAEALQIATKTEGLQRDKFTKPQYYGAYAGGLVAGMMAEAAKGGKHPACVVAVNDPLGITQDLACLCQPSFYGDRPEVRRYWTDQMLSQIEAALISDGYHKQDKSAKAQWEKWENGTRHPPYLGQSAHDRAVEAANRQISIRKDLNDIYFEPPKSYTKQWSDIAQSLNSIWPADRVYKAVPDSKAINLPLVFPYDLRKAFDKDGLQYVSGPFQTRRAAYQLKRGEARQQRSHPFAKPYEDFANGSELTATRTLHASWLGGSVLAEYFSAWFIRGDISHGVLYDIELAKCLVGAADVPLEDNKQPYLQVVLNWLAKPDMKDDHNLLLRAISWNMDAEVADYFTTALHEADSLIQLAPQVSASLLTPALSAEEQKKQLQDSWLKHGITYYSKLDKAWGLLAKRLAASGQKQPEHIPELLAQHGLLPRTLNVLTPILTRRFGSQYPKTSALLTAALSFSSGKPCYLIQGSAKQATAGLLHMINTANPKLLATLQSNGEDINKLTTRLQQKLATATGKHASRPQLFVADHDSAVAFLQEGKPLVLTPAGAVRTGSAIHTTITHVNLVLDILLLRYGIAAITSVPDYKRDSELWALLCSTVSLSGSLSSSIGKLLDSYAAAKLGVIVSKGAIFDYGVLSEKASKLTIWGKRISAAVMLLGAVTDGYKAGEFFEEKQSLRGFIFAISGAIGFVAGVATLIATLAPETFPFVATAVAWAPGLTAIALLAAGVAWYFTPSDLEEWARDSIFGSRTNRKHLRDDLDAFDKLALIQTQHQEPAHA